RSMSSWRSAWRYRSSRLSMACCSNWGLAAVGAVTFWWSLVLHPAKRSPSPRSTHRFLRRCHPELRSDSMHAAPIVVAPLGLSKMIDQRREHRVLIDRGIRSSAVHCPSAEGVRHVEHELLHGDPSAETKAKKVISAPLTRLWIVECPGTEGHHNVGQHPQILRSQTHAGGVIGEAVQHGPPLPRGRTVLDQEHIRLAGGFQPKI